MIGLTLFFLVLGHPCAAETIEKTPKDTALYFLGGARPKAPDLQFTEKGPAIEIHTQGKKISIIALISGHCPIPHASLIWKDDILPVRDGGDFSFPATLLAQNSKIEISVIDSHGTIRKQEVIIYIPEWKKLKETPSQKRNLFFAGGGLSRIQVTDSRFDPFNEWGVTSKLGYTFLLAPPRWDLGLTTYFTIASFAASRADSARFFGVNLRLGYALPFIQEPWKLSLFFGGYYTTMFVASNTFGFTNMTGPQIYPTLRRTLNKGDSILVYFKFSPVSADFSLSPLTNHEIATGLSYTYLMLSGHTWGLSLDASQLSLVIDGVATNGTIIPVTITSSSLSFGASFGY